MAVKPKPVKPSEQVPVVGPNWDDDGVRVKCVVTTLPWTDTKPLAKDEVATVSEEVAALMETNGQVVRL